MINRMYFISDSTPAGQPEENVHYVVTADPMSEQSTGNTYRMIADTPLPALGLALPISRPLPETALRFAAATCFLPSFLHIDDRPVILLMGHSQELLEQASATLHAYLGRQGLATPLIYRIGALFTSPRELTAHYTSLLAGDHCYGNELFFYASSPEVVAPTLSTLSQIEQKFKHEFPAQTALIQAYQLLEKELRSLRRKQASIEAELSHQKQYVEVLRSNHSTRELQDYYTNEYEILPLWFKRLGHLVKVLTGKRTFRSLFRDDVKKYKD